MVQRQNFEVVQVNDDQSEQEKKLRPLCGVAHERLDVLHHARADVAGKQAWELVQKSIKPEKIPPTLSRFLRFGPAIEIDHAGNPCSRYRQKQRIARQKRKGKALARFAVEQAPGEDFRRPTAR